MKPMKKISGIVFGIAVSISMTIAGVGPAPAFALDARDVASHCDSAAKDASIKTGVPMDVLMAISRIETGRTIAGELAPWPWAVNQAGQGSFFETAIQAMDHVETAMAEGKSNIDVGCFQINVRWHGASFASLGNMFEPTENALYAARFLLRLYDEYGTWDAAIGAYHSRKPEAAAGYLAKVAGLLNTPDRLPDPKVIATRPKSGNPFPLLRPGTPRGYGSLVATDFDDRPVPLLR